MAIQAKYLIALGIIAALVSLSSCTLDASFKSGLEHFSTNLFHEIVSVNGNNNIIFSPFSAQTCLAMARMGAEGETAAELDRAMGFSGKSSEFIADNYFDLLSLYENSGLVQLANKVYVMDRYELQDNYKKILNEKFLSSAENINFAQNEKAAQTMNSWVASKTNNLIKDVMVAKMLSSDTRLVLLNAIYFKGAWLKAFDASRTHDAKFYVDETNTVSVPMMYVKGRFESGYLSDINAHTLRLPYKDSDLSMLIFLPREKTGLLEMEKKLMEYSMDTLTKKMHHGAVEVYLPKFKAESTLALKDSLKKLNLKHLFEDANLDKMLTSPEPLTVSAIVQKAFIEVNEVGTEAAAATALLAEGRSRTPQLNADHPFHYVILNTENVVLFQGNVVNPLM